LTEEEGMDVYINDMAVFLPNAPVDNDHIEQVLGKIGSRQRQRKKFWPTTGFKPAITRSIRQRAN
jgi:hypothetical protein